MGDSFVVFLWLVLIVTGSVLEQKFGEYGECGTVLHDMLVDGPGMHLKWSCNDEFSVLCGEFYVFVWYQFGMNHCPFVVIC